MTAVLLMSKIVAFLLAAPLWLVCHMQMHEKKMHMSCAGPCSSEKEGGSLQCIGKTLNMLFPDCEH